MRADRIRLSAVVVWCDDRKVCVGVGDDVEVVGEDVQCEVADDFADFRISHSGRTGGLQRHLIDGTSSTAPRLRAMASERASRAAECGSDDSACRARSISSASSFATFFPR